MTRVALPTRPDSRDNVAWDVAAVLPQVGDTAAITRKTAALKVVHGGNPAVANARLTLYSNCDQLQLLRGGSASHGGHLAGLQAAGTCRGIGFQPLSHATQLARGDSGQGRVL